MPIEILTDLGVSKIASAAGSGDQVAITHIALGDANAVAYDPAGDQTALVNERVRQPIIYRELIDTATWRAKAEFPPETPNFVVREMGFFDADGDLIAIRGGVDLVEGETGYVTYLVQHDINFSNVADGAVIVYAPNPDGEAMINQFLTEKDALIAARLAQLDTAMGDLAGVVEDFFDQQYYVSATGDDTADGTAGAPFRTIGAALNRAGSGSRVRIEIQTDFDLEETVTIAGGYVSIDMNNHTLTQIGDNRFSMKKGCTLSLEYGLLKTAINPGNPIAMVLGNGDNSNKNLFLTFSSVEFGDADLSAFGTDDLGLVSLVHSRGTMTINPARTDTTGPYLMNGLAARQAFVVNGSQYVNSTGIPYIDLFTGLRRDGSGVPMNFMGSIAQ